MHAVYCDFEYRDDGRQLILGCFWSIPDSGPQERVEIDFRRPEATPHLRLIQHKWRGATWMSYSAHAELSCFLTAGLDIADMPWIDLFCEARQITGTHQHYATRKAGLLQALEAFGIATTGSVVDKEIMRALILSSATYTAAEWNKIKTYCWTDLDPLPLLWAAIQQVHADKQKPYQTRTAIFRAEYLKALAQLEHRSSGFPVDLPLMERIYANQRPIRKALAEDCNAHYGGAIFRYVKNKDQYSFHFAGLTEHLKTLPFDVHWELTPTGKLRMDEQYLDDFSKRNEYFKPLAETKRLLDQLKTGDMRTLVRDGHIKGASIPFYTLTGRNQPLVSRGFLLNLPPWLRFIVRPQPRRVVIGADWSQQEIYLGAALSGDRQLAAALKTGDVYLALAKMAGAVPQDATKQSHPVARQTYKTSQLGVGYGMGAPKLGLRIYLDLLDSAAPISLDEATERAVEILQWHRATFVDYWAFIAREVTVAKEQGWIRAKDGWTCFANQNSRYTQLQNFHMQANAAVILRECIKLLAQYPEIDLMCTLHDAVYINCHRDDAELHENILRRCMDQAVSTVMHGTPMPLDIPVSVTRYTEETGYYSDRGKTMFDRVMKLLDDLPLAHQSMPT